MADPFLADVSLRNVVRPWPRVRGDRQCADRSLRENGFSVFSQYVEGKGRYQAGTSAFCMSRS
jgi:hypothetical protein